MIAREHRGGGRLGVAHEEREVARRRLEADVAAGAAEAAREHRSRVERDRHRTKLSGCKPARHGLACPDDERDMHATARDCW